MIDSVKSVWGNLSHHFQGDPLEKEMATHSSILAMKTPWTMSPSGQKVSNMLLGKSRGLVLVAPERMKRLGQSQKDTQLLMYLVVKGESDAVKKKGTAEDEVARWSH
uniref:Uncharacterized protein n=1 Tax=Varanus komodoensis TaxID=61221 RepID=A0A8D2L671_VARKO